MKKLSTTLFFIISLISFVSKSEIIESIKVEGLDTISRGTLLSYLQFEAGDNISEEIIKTNLNKLMETSFFEQVSFTFKDSVLTLKVKENPVIKFFDFFDFNNGDVLSDDLVKKIKENSGLKQGKIFDPKKLENLIQELKTLYQMNAYYDIKISRKIEIDDFNRVGIELFFDEGSPSKIKSFNVEGNQFFSSETLLDLFEIGEPDFFLINYLTEKDRFDQRKFDAGIEKVKSKYIDSGFLAVEIKDKKITVSEDKKNMDINFSVIEGPQFRIGNINFGGDTTNISRKHLLSLLEINSNDILIRKKIISGIQKIRSIFADKGYAFASVDSKLVKTSKGNSFDVNIMIDLNGLTYVNRIEISGNNKTQDDVIRRELNILEGGLYSQEQIKESIKRVRRLGYFSDVSYDINKAKNRADAVNLSIRVTETKTGEFSIGVSHSNSTGPAFSVGVKQSNILGTGNTLNARFVNSSAIQDINFFFSDPYFTNDRDSIRYGFFNKKTDAANLDVGSYIIDESGLTLGYGMPLDSSSDINLDFRLSNIDLACGATFSSALYEQQQCGSSDKIDNSISLEYIHNSLNDFYNPTDGSRTSLEFSLSSPLGDFNYYQIQGKTSNYTGISDEVSLMLKSDLKFAQGYGNDDLPFFKRYFGGGSSSVRGFDFNTLGSKYPNGDPKGGELSFLSSAALITPAKNLGIDNDNIRLSSFFDMGSISESVSSFEFSDIRASTGVSLSWLTPVGPLGFNIAAPIIKKTDDSTEAFSFQLGTRF